MDWSINEKIASLHRVITGVADDAVYTNLIVDRLIQLSIISLLHDVNNRLEMMRKELDNRIILEGVNIDFDTYLNKDYWMDNFLFHDESNFYKAATGKPIEELSCRFQINEMTDYLPNGEEGYNITQDLLDTFRNSLNQLCDRNKLGYREIRYALFFGIMHMLKLLGEIKEKVEHPKPHQFVKIWEEVYEDEKDTTSWKSYTEWKEENEGCKVEDLKRQQLYAIFKLLDSGFFRLYNSITGADVKRRKLIITEDDLPIGSTIPEKMPVECAKFEKFSEWKGEYILTLNYEKLGQYLYKNYFKLELEDLINIVAFDKTIDEINEDIAKEKTSLSQYLKGYEDNIINQLFNDCSEILNTCQKHLANDFRPSFLKDYLQMLLLDKEMKVEARKKLMGASRNTYICEMIAALKNCRVFRIDCDKNDLANSLCEKITNVEVATLEKYIERFYNANEGPLYEWTKKNIDDLKAQSGNPFAGIT